jgi:hypothetical protein
MVTYHFTVNSGCRCGSGRTNLFSSAAILNASVPARKTLLIAPSFNELRFFEVKTNALY